MARPTFVASGRELYASGVFSVFLAVQIGLTDSLHSSESQESADKGFSLRDRCPPDVYDAATTAQDSDLRGGESCEPFTLKLETQMVACIKSDAASEAKREAGEADAGSDGNVRRADAAQYIRLDPGRPLLDVGLVAEIPVKLIEKDPGARNFRSDLL